MSAHLLHRIVPDRSSSGAGAIYVTRWCCSQCGTSWRGLPALDQRRGCSGERKAAS